MRLCIFIAFLPLGAGAAEQYYQPRFERSATISLRRLAHRVPAAARREMARFRRYLTEGKTEAAALHIHRAIRADPDFAEAHNGLGVLHHTAGRHAEALTSYRRAMELDPASPVIQRNVAAVLLLLKDYREAERAARRAVQLDPGALPTRLVLAASMIFQGRFDDEVRISLLRAREELADARLFLAAYYWETGRREESLCELRDYLASANPSGRRGLEQWLAAAQRVVPASPCTGGPAGR